MPLVSYIQVRFKQMLGYGPCRIHDPKYRGPLTCPSYLSKVRFEKVGQLGFRLAYSTPVLT